MQFRYTRHQVPRGSRPDAETPTEIILAKNVSVLRATYQIRLLAFRATEEARKLVLRVPRSCRFDTSLERLMEKARGAIRRENV